MSPEQVSLETVIGYTFRDGALLRRALTHKSFAHEQPSTTEAGPPGNQQLEFLGDAVLGLLASELLVERFPALAEGRLSKLKAQLVSADHLYEAAVELDLGRHLLLGRGEDRSGGRAKRALLGDALEALIAAIYLDGGLAEARSFVRRHVAGDLDARPADQVSPVADYKSALQERAQAKGLPPPRYAVVKERGPEHAKSFLIEVSVGPELTARAEAHSKKSASQQAARLLLDHL